MNKSLAPLIIILSLIILATFIIVNSRSDKQQDGHSNGHAADVRHTPLGIDLEPTVTERTAPPVRPGQRQRRPRSEDVDTFKILTEVRTLMANGQLAQAEDSLRTLLIFNPDNSVALSLIGGILYATGRYDDATSFLRRKSALQPGNPAVSDELGLILWGKGDIAGAAGEFKQACELAPDSPSYLLHLAGICALAGQKEDALRHFLKAAQAIGPQIVPLSFDPAYDPIRNHPDFIAAVEKARQQLPILPAPLPSPQTR